MLKCNIGLEYDIDLEQFTYNGVVATGHYKTFSAEHWLKNGLFHREDGPAYISKEFDPWIEKFRAKLLWFINGIDINYEVNKWIKENNYPEWTDDSWNDATKIHFKMSFG